jgi:flavin-dependent dehydrogenase
MVDCDITICGAGVAGLLMASELSKRYSVVVLEKARHHQCSKKFWFTRRECLEVNPHLNACVDSEWDALDFIANSRSKYTVKGKYILWNTKKLENCLIEAIKANGSQILYQHRFYSYGQTENHIIAHANASSFRSRLLIDCMGYSSPIVRATGAVSMLGYQHLFGQTMQLKCPVNPIAADNVLLSRPPSFLEVFPKSDGTANVVLIAPAKTAQSLSTLGRDFRFIVNNTHYSNILAPLPDAAPLYGVVPIGRIKKRALDRVLFFGEAGQTHPAASCTCLNKMLLGLRGAASRVSDRIESNRLKARDLEDVMPHMRRFAQRFHQNLFRQLGTWTSDQGQAFVDLLSCIDHKSLDDLIFGEIAPSHFMQINNWKRVIRTRNTAWVKPLAQTVFNL